MRAKTRWSASRAAPPLKYMSTEQGKTESAGFLANFRNWTSLTGLLVMAASVFAFVLLLFIDALSHFSNPYLGILSYLVAPAFLFFGLFLLLLGAVLRRRRMGKARGMTLTVRIDLSRARDRRILMMFVFSSVAFLLITALGSYHTYHYTESVQFCGLACHSVMKPEYVTYSHSPHAKVACAECHIGAGATWYVRSKLSGTYQVYATMADKYPRPIPTPVKNLRPAQETCEECQWPKKFVGNLDRTYNYYLQDATNTPYSIRLALKVGGGDPTHGPVGGIHWHMNVGNKIEYVASDEARQTIPWVRMTDAQGAVTVFKSASFTNDINALNVRTMDCVDCHNRPAHSFASPENAVDLAITLNHIDRSLPYVKTNAIDVLIKPYTTETEALQNIATTLKARYATNDQAAVTGTIAALQQIYQDNFFPEMKSSWKVYPNNIGHKDWPGCFRCHDGKHTTGDGKRTIKANDCNACHTILAQGSGAKLEQLSALGQKFAHPGDPDIYDPAFQCTDCHQEKAGKP